ncbi:MAG: hypothetical protein DMG09_10545 [Acidobacteria bacterium]|nr:MAG: hypothetical protein DMG09_10545 [Acidobacteriota bacterium]
MVSWLSNRAKVSGSEEGLRWQQRPDLWCPVLLVLAGILFFFDAIFSSKNFYFRDILNFHYPLHKVMIESYAQGEFPLWNPYIYLGQPMLANPNHMAFYPSNLFHLFLPFNYAFKLHFIVHPILGGLGLYFLQRRLGINGLAAFGGSLAYQFSGPVLSFLNLYSIVQAVALMPWMAWAFLGALYDSHWRRILVFGAVLALQIITFEPLLLQCSLWLLAGIALLYLLESGERTNALRTILRVGAVGGMFGLALAAVQILPTLELLPRSIRAGGYDFKTVSDWSMRPLELLNIVVPHLFGNPYTIDGSAYWGEMFHRGREGYLVSFFFGAGSALLSILSIFSPRKRLKLIFAALALISPLYRVLYEWVPVFRMGRYPSKYFLLATLALAVLVSLGIEVAQKTEERSDRTRRSIMILAAAAAAVSVFGFAAWVYFQHHPGVLESWIRSKTDPNSARIKDYPAMASQLKASVRSSATWLGLLSVLLLSPVSRRRPALWTSMIVLILVAELASTNLRLIPIMSEEDVNFVPAVNSYLERLCKNELGRVVPADSPREIPGKAIWAPNRSWAWLTYYFRKTGQPLYGIMNGIQYSVFFSVDDLNTRQSRDLLKKCSSLPSEAALLLLARMNSRYLLTVNDVSNPNLELLSSFDTNTDVKLNVYRLKNFLPRAYFASVTEQISSKEEALERLSTPEFSAHKTLIIADPGSVPAQEGDGRGEVRILSYRRQWVQCEVVAETDGYLVLLDSYYPGWRAYFR